MKIRSLVVAAAAAVLAIAPAGAAAAAPPPVAGSQGPVYYLALGDSLAQGWQPITTPGPNLGVGHVTNAGYVDDLAQFYGFDPTPNSNRTLVKLGCPGETTGTMIHGGVCPANAYASLDAGTQLQAAVNFLRAHRGHVPLVTIDIGANNVDGCFSATTGIDTACIANGLAAARRDLPRILAALRAADPHGLIVGMTYYDPFLAVWLTGATTQAQESVPLADQFNQLLSADYQHVGMPVADVAAAFSTDDMTDMVTLPGVSIPVPLNVTRICEWTWMCAPWPVGPNIHANPAGYQVMADAFKSAIESNLPASTLP